ncbi:glutathione S-transferase [Pleomassaria siparia CBS 279.74]|uniref:Glutathione S-transferase n=1 Tax=Pleomassaria siparia CBS 279.74 TaxID=1314801 RepID=A0A6G1KQD1_9PLEO|nr:glutathione S-transferase [Pleomassaria siparia CBS 279.74]
MTSAQIPLNKPVDEKGNWKRIPSRFRNPIPSEHFPAESGRYVLYVNYSCPWAHRTILAHGLKGLEDIVQLVEVDAKDPAHGWWFSGKKGPDRDPVYGVKYVKELYLKADPQYNGRITVPLLWDKKHETIVNNESSEILRMFIENFDDFLPPNRREANKGPAALIPQRLRSDIDTLNAWVYENINNGVYKTGFASSQVAYDEHVTKLFDALDRVEDHLSEPSHRPYLFGDYITEADIRLYTTLIRFDISYYTIFKCNKKMIRLDYPRIHEWLRRLYWNEGPETAGGVFKHTTFFDAIKHGYSSVAAGNGIVPAGPVPHILPL